MKQLKTSKRWWPDGNKVILEANVNSQVSSILGVVNHGSTVILIDANTSYTAQQWTQSTDLKNFGAVILSLDAAPLSLFVTEALLKLQVPVVVLPKSIFTQLAHSLSNLSAACDSSLCLNEMTIADLTYKLSAAVEFSLLTSSQYPFEIVNRITPKSYHFRPFSRPPKR